MIIKNIVLSLIKLCNIMLFHSIQAQSLKHPVIWVTEDERVDILDKIDKYDWAKSIVNQLHNKVDDELKAHQENPNRILNSIPAFAKNDHENSERKAGPLAAGHNKVLALASEAGMLYYITQEEKYAQFAADILSFYIDHIAPLTPETTTICGYDFFDPRTTYGPCLVSYALKMTKSDNACLIFFGKQVQLTKTLLKILFYLCLANKVFGQSLPVIVLCQ